MATNNIKIFDQNKVNMLTDEAYNTSTQRLNGVQQGIASSQLQNKTLYQVSLVAYAIGQMMQANGLNANDADAVSTFAGNLSSTIVQKILDKASTIEAKNFTVNDKFITPQTWKAAYDFMKADSNMVTSAVDDTHYITPKLLKEGAEKYGDKVRLNDGSLGSGFNLGNLYVSQGDTGFFSYPILNDKAYIIRNINKKQIQLVNVSENLSVISTINFDKEIKILFADEENLIVYYVNDNKTYTIEAYKKENESFTQVADINAGSQNYGSTAYYYIPCNIRPSYINCTKGIINMFIYILGYQFYYTKALKYDTVAKRFVLESTNSSVIPIGNRESYTNYTACINKEEQLVVCNGIKSSNSSVTRYEAEIARVYDLTLIGSVKRISISLSDYNYYWISILSCYDEYIYLYVCNVFFKIKYDTLAVTSISSNLDKISSSIELPQIKKYMFYPSKEKKIFNLETNTFINTEENAFIGYLPIVTVESYYGNTFKGRALGFTEGNFTFAFIAEVLNNLAVNSSGFIEVKKVKLVGLLT